MFAKYTSITNNNDNPKHSNSNENTNDNDDHNTDSQLLSASEVRSSRVWVHSRNLHSLESENSQDQQTVTTATVTTTCFDACARTHRQLLGSLNNLWLQLQLRWQHHVYHIMLCYSTSFQTMLYIYIYTCIYIYIHMYTYLSLSLYLSIYTYTYISSIIT